MPLPLLHVALGLGALIVGLLTLRRALRGLIGTRSQRWLQRLVRTPSRGLVTGMVATWVTQSSGAVTVLSMGLVSAGAITFADTVGIVLGTNIGSTATVSLLSLHLDAAGPIALATGAAGVGVAALLPRGLRTRALLLSLAVVGFGAMFAGFALIGNALAPLASSPKALTWLEYARAHPWLAVAFGATTTALVGSSSATTALTVALANSGAILPTAAAGIVFGNNIGTCVTAVLAALAGGRDMQRIAATHVLLNVCATIVFMLALQPFVALVTGLVRDPGQQVALMHVSFNVISSLVALPFSHQIATGITRLLPDGPRH